MNTKVRKQNWSGLTIMVYSIIVCLALAAVFRSTYGIYVIHKDSRYLRLEILADKAVFDNNELIRSMDDSSPESIGLNPMLMQVKTNLTFAELAQTVKRTPQEFVSPRVKQLLEDGPRKLVMLPKDNLTAGDNVH